MAVVAEEKNVSQGSNGYYDVRLEKIEDGRYLLIVTMSILFNFIPNKIKSSVKWSSSEERDFIGKWEQQVSSTWDDPDRKFNDGDKLAIEFRFDIKPGTSFPGSQWQIYVEKMESASDFTTSSVWRNQYESGYDAQFDSNDWRKKSLLGDGTQTAIIHEFGHMIGHSDEYKENSPHFGDKESVMSKGSAVRDRHYEHLMTWAQTKLKAAQQTS